MVVAVVTIVSIYLCELQGFLLVFACPRLEKNRMVALRLAGTRTTTTTTGSTVPFCVPEGTSSQKSDQK